MPPTEDLLDAGSQAVAHQQSAREQHGGEDADAEWAVGQERAVTAHLSRLENPFLDVTDVECLTSCCRVALDFTFLDIDAKDSGLIYNAVLFDLQSEVGFGTWSNAMALPQNGDVAFYACFDRSTDTLAKPSPDRIEERAALLEASTSALKECTGSSGLFFISVLLSIDTEGSTEVRETYGGEDYQGVVECIENVLLGWQFEPAPLPGFLSIPLFLDSAG